VSKDCLYKVEGHKDNTTKVDKISRSKAYYSW